MRLRKYRIPMRCTGAAKPVSLAMDFHSSRPLIAVVLPSNPINGMT
ncbi:hypothetical protein [Novipirellula galeiformis]|nr:hypothetical protein [Novipirellula galeiformis]